MKKYIAVFTVLILLISSCVSVSAAVSGAAYEGKWEDTYSQRAWMRIDENKYGSYDVRIFWGAGIYEGSEWYMTCVYDSTVGQLAYNNGCHYNCCYDGQGNLVSAEVDYEGASGILYFDSNGYLNILSTDSELNRCQFVWG